MVSDFNFQIACLGLCSGDISGSLASALFAYCFNEKSDGLLQPSTTMSEVAESNPQIELAEPIARSTSPSHDSDQASINGNRLEQRRSPLKLAAILVALSVCGILSFSLFFLKSNHLAYPLWGLWLTNLVLPSCLFLLQL